jgi:monovalent cation/hydrogen antiporter
MVFGLELVVAVGTAVLMGTVVARRTALAPSVLLLGLGVVLSVLPTFRDVGLPPDAVLLLFLPALLYWESLTTSLREIRRSLRGIILSSTLLVVVTAGVVAIVAHGFGVDWGPAWVIGAAVAPTDATAVASLSGSLRRRDLTVLRAESLVNDGTALVVYGLAIGVTTGEASLSGWQLTGRFVLSFGGGLLLGLATGVASYQVRRRLQSPLDGNTATLLTPFVAYLAAESVHASGVLAVVTCGLFMSQVAPRAISAQTRQQSQAFWTLATFLLNGALFVLIGLQVPSAVRGLSSLSISQAVGLSAAVYVTMIAVRFGFLNLAIFLIRAIDRRPQQRARRTTLRGRVVSTVAGLRGAVSLAVALAVPETLPDGGAFPVRDAIIFVVAAVVLSSLVLQGLALPAVIRWAHAPADTAFTDELHLAKRAATEEALDALGELASQHGVAPEVESLLRSEYEEHLAALLAHQDGDDDDPSVQRADQYTRLRRAVIAHKRATVIRLRDTDVVDDTVLRRIQAQLDAEDVRLSGPQEVD